MKDLDFGAAFLGRFAVPLAAGGQVSVGVPLLQKGAERLQRAVAAGLDQSQLGRALTAARRTIHGELGIHTDEPLLALDRESIRLVSALHDALFLFHPRGRELSPSRRAGLLAQVRRQLVTASEALPEPSVESARDGTALSMLLGRYGLLAGLWTLRPASTHRPQPGGSASIEQDVLAAPIDAEERPLVRYLGLGCPLLLLLRPPPGPLTLTELVPWLQLGQVARLFVTFQLRQGSALAIERVGAAVLHGIDDARREKAALPGDPIQTLLTVFSLIHLRTALSEQTPPAGDDALRDALALYAVVSQSGPHLAAPPDVRADPQLMMQVTRYQQLCIERAGNERLRAMRKRCAQVLREPDDH